jgi:HPr kinase/phosphorylase
MKKKASISAEALFQEYRSSLKWEWLAGHARPDRQFAEVAIREARAAADLIGYLNYIHPYRVQLVGAREVAYLNDPAKEVVERRIARIVTLEPPLIIVADGQEAPERLIAMCDRADIPLFYTEASAGYVIDLLRSYLSQIFAERITRHGVFLDILGMGVLLTGESGLGKSELGLELISRGHGLVADDAVDFYRVSEAVIEGRCPELLRNLLEVRGIGLLDIKSIFGETAVRRKMRLKLIVYLVRSETMERDFDRIPDEPLHEEVLGTSIRKVVIAVDAGRNLAVLVEAAVRNTILQLRGINTYQEFIQRHQLAMENSLEDNEPESSQLKPSL